MRIIAIFLLSIMLCCTCAYAQEDNRSNLLDDIDISGQWFLAYQEELSGEEHQNQFILRRGYLTFKKRFNEHISVRFTQDITLDEEGSDAGNVEMRLKYLYLKLEPSRFLGLKHSHFEFGMVHRPWMDFEEKIDRYRVQGTMFTERVRLMNSADFGVTFVSLFGGEIDKEYQENVNSAYPGKYGSIVLGVYNGGGYHALEMNNNKTMEGRISIRPFPSKLPGIQASYGFAAGKGNIPESPDFYLQQVALSYASSKVRVFMQGVKGKGNSFGSFVNEDFKADEIMGYSIFAEVFALPSLSLIGRADAFERDGDHPKQQRWIAGICYHFLNGQKVLLNTDQFDDGQEKTRVYELAIEIRF